MIGSLLYVTASRLDIMQAIGLVAGFQYAPKERHVLVVKRIFRYLKGTLDFDLWYSRSKDFTLTSYIDVDWERSIDDNKSTIGEAFFLGNCLVSWLRKKQNSISLSIEEVEYIAATTCFTQVLYTKQTLKNIKEECDHPNSIICNNTSEINISKNLFVHSKTKHIPIKYHFLRDR
jgi:hypothetical protein